MISSHPHPPPPTPLNPPAFSHHNILNSNSHHPSIPLPTLSAPHARINTFTLTTPTTTTTITTNPPTTLSSSIQDTLHMRSNNRLCKKKYTLNEQYHSPTLALHLAELARYWTEPNNLQRREAKTNDTTHKKRKERILCFMGWCKAMSGVDQPDFTLFDISRGEENRERYERYLDYLRNERKLNAGTMIEHFTSAIYALKMLFARYQATPIFDPLLFFFSIHMAFIYMALAVLTGLAGLVGFYTKSFFM